MLGAELSFCSLPSMYTWHLAGSSVAPLGEKLTWTLSPDQSLPFPEVMIALGSGITPTGMGVPFGAEAARDRRRRRGRRRQGSGRQRGHGQHEQRGEQRDAHGARTCVHQDENLLRGPRRGPAQAPPPHSPCC